jgi:hypothetical protein
MSGFHHQNGDLLVPLRAINVVFVEIEIKNNYRRKFPSAQLVR